MLHRAQSGVVLQVGTSRTRQSSTGASTSSIFLASTGADTFAASSTHVNVSISNKVSCFMSRSRRIFGFCEQGFHIGCYFLPGGSIAALTSEVQNEISAQGISILHRLQSGVLVQVRASRSRQSTGPWACALMARASKPTNKKQRIMEPGCMYMYTATGIGASNLAFEEVFAPGRMAKMRFSHPKKNGANSFERAASRYLGLLVPVGRAVSACHPLILKVCGPKKFAN